MTRTHSHPCATCSAKVECSGDYARNYDGFPEVICTSYHLPYGSIAEVVCEDCHSAAEAARLADEAEEKREEAEAAWKAYEAYLLSGGRFSVGEAEEDEPTVGEGARERLARRVSAADLDKL